MNDKANKALGRRGEEAAASYLTDKGYEIIGRNWHCSRGEIDIIARAGECYVFVEVKTAGVNSSLDPREYLTKTKLKRLEVSSMLYLSEETPEIDPYYRIDFLAVSETREGMSISHFKAVSAEQYD